jgi:hypothetical protein
MWRWLNEDIQHAKHKNTEEEHEETIVVARARGLAIRHPCLTCLSMGFLTSVAVMLRMTVRVEFLSHLSVLFLQPAHAGSKHAESSTVPSVSQGHDDGQQSTAGKRQEENVPLPFFHMRTLGQ